MESIKHKLIVSCQALEDEPLHSEKIMARMAFAAVSGGAKGIRANSVKDILAIKKEVSVPVIGIIKKVYGSCDVFITPTIKEVEEVIKTGAEIVALDGTSRKRPDGASLDEIMKFLKSKYKNQLFMADVSNLEEAKHCEKLGFDFIGTTLVGYTDYTKGDEPLETLKKIIKNVKTKVIAEGNINTPEMAKKALELGAYSVVVGSIITRPQIITRNFATKMQEFEENIKNNKNEEKYFALDFGGTDIKYGIIDKCLNVISSSSFSLKKHKNTDSLLSEIFSIIEKEKCSFSGIGISCTGQIDEKSGKITGGLNLIENWVGLEIKKIFEEKYKIPVYVNNDVKCVALSEISTKKISENFLCIAIGTGIGGAIVNKGELFTGDTNTAGEFGHFIFKEDGILCGCSKKGCFEKYGSMSALISKVHTLTGKNYNGKMIFEMVKNRNETYEKIVEDWILDIAKGISLLVQILDLNTVVIGGAISAQKELFIDKLKETTFALTNREINLKGATFLNEAGMIGSVYGILKNEYYL